VKTFKLSRDAKFLERLSDVAGFYLNTHWRSCGWPASGRTSAGAGRGMTQHSRRR